MNSLFKILLLLVFLLSQSCKLIEIPIRIPVELATSELQHRDRESSFFGKPYLGFRKDCERVRASGQSKSGMNPFAVLLMPADLVLGTLFLPVDMSVMGKQGLGRDSGVSKKKKEPELIEKRVDVWEKYYREPSSPPCSVEGEWDWMHFNHKFTFHNNGRLSSSCNLVEGYWAKQGPDEYSIEYKHAFSKSITKMILSVDGDLIEIKDEKSKKTWHRKRSQTSEIIGAN